MVRHPLSVVILTKNEAGRIRACIDSVRWAQEVLVIDDESSDDTVRLAEALGARVLTRKMDIEGRHRNWAYAQAAHEWILSLDADERVTPELAQELQALLAGEPPCQVYAIPRRNYIGAHWIRHGGWYPSAQIKCFQRSVFRWEETTVHPRALSNCPSGTLQHDLLHYSYRDLADFVDKLNRQTTLEAEKWLRDGRRMSWRRAAWRTIDRGFRSYVGKEGWRDGFWGLVVAWFAGAYQLLAWAKYAEAQRAARIEDIVAPFRELTVDAERFDRPLLMSHLCAYRLAGRFARQGRMLELGCGTGYGAYYLGHLAHEVVAVDLDRDNIARAERVFQRPNVRYVPMDATQLALADGSFDCAGTFQVIEHIPEPRLRQFLTEIQRVLVPGGVLVVSTLNLAHNCKDPTTYQKPSFHEKEFTAGELKRLLESVFPEVRLYGLYPGWRYRVFQRLKKWGLDRWSLGWNPVRRFFEDGLMTDAFVLRSRCTPRAIDLIGVCRTATNGHGVARA